MTPPYELGKPHRNWPHRWPHLVRSAGLGFLIAASPAFAGSDFVLMSGAPTTVPLTGGGWKVIPPAPGSSPDATRVWLGRMVSGTTTVEEALQIPGRAGAVPARVQQAVKVVDAAAAVARCLKAPVVCAAIAAGLTAGAYYFYRKYRTRPDGNGGLESDPGQPKQPYSTYTCDFGFGYTGHGDSVASACSDAAAQVQSAQGGTAVNGGCYMNTNFYVSSNSSGPTLRKTVTYTSRDGQYCSLAGSTSDFFVGGSVVGNATVQQCPPVVNFYDPAYSVPGGPVGPDGKCPTGTYTERVTPDQAAQRVVAYPPPDGDTSLPDALREAVEHGQAVPSTIKTTGPATQTGQPTTTTTTTGTGTSSTTQTPTYTYHYDGDTITYDTTVNNTTINNDGSTTSSSTTTTGPTPDKDPKDPCETNPQRVGCMGLGDPPTDAVTKRESSLAWQTESVGLAAACPSDLVIQQQHGPSITLSYRDACDTATRLQPLIVAAGALAALLMVTAALRNA